MTFRIRQKLLGSVLLAGSISTVLFASPALAAAQPIEQVTVTASKREELIREVPMAVTAITGKTLEHLNAVSFSDYINRVPGMTLVQADPTSARLVLRGIDSGGVGQTLANYLDETPYGSSSALANGAITTANIDTFDIARIEVLRGPQGTLYGSSTLGGLIKFVTNAPDPSAFDDKVELGVNSTEHGEVGWSAKGMLNIPLADNMAIRASAYYRKDGGFIDDVFQNRKDVNGSKTVGGRVTWLWTPSDNFTIRASVLAQNLDSNGDAEVDVVATGIAPNLTPLFGDLSQARVGTQSSDVRYRLYNATADWNLGWSTLTSITSYGTFSGVNVQDGTGVFGLFVVGHLDQKKITQEVRLASPEGQPLEWLAGFYYTHETGTLHQDLTLTPTSASLAFLELDSRYIETAGFANLTYHFSPAFDVSVGGRWSTNSQHANQFGLASAGGDSSENVFTWSVAPRWHVNEDTMIYGRIAKGFRPGGPNALPPIVPPGVPFTFGSDSLTNYELGVKTELLDGRLQIDADVFYIEWENIQLLSVVGGFGVNNNGGSATSKGVEWSATWVPVDPLKIIFNGAWTDAKLTEDTDPILIGAVSGDRLPYAPRFSTSLDVDYTFNNIGEYTPYIGGSWRYIGQRDSGFDPAVGQTRLDSYNEIDLRAGVERDNWSLQVFAKNLFDEQGISLVGSNNSVVSGSPTLAVTRPRVIGVTLTGKL